MTAVVVPQLSISMDEAKVGRWLVEDGEAVVAGQLVVEVETDKATVEIEAPAAGLLRIVAVEGAIVAVDGVLAELEPAAPAAVGTVAADGDAVVGSASVDAASTAAAAVSAAGFSA
jgi:pyruvate/2-oxoglutarate dehydrogenase complex dihydrolipoamide acyltransferase (E2) component